ncbi:MAG: hypothetical protein M3349_09610 [Actinomycetota bacterium]|nr:hypothetical protein [Actinomycetota bacterium]
MEDDATLDGMKLQFETKWDLLKSRIKEAWDSLTDDDLDRTDGQWDQVVAIIQDRTGESEDTIEDRLGQMVAMVGEDGGDAIAGADDTMADTSPTSGQDTAEAIADGTSER